MNQIKNALKQTGECFTEVTDRGQGVWDLGVLVMSKCKGQWECENREVEQEALVRGEVFQTHRLRGEVQRISLRLGAGVQDRGQSTD